MRRFEQWHQNSGGAKRSSIWCNQDIIFRNNPQHSLEEHFRHGPIRLWRHAPDMIFALVGDLGLLIGATIVEPTMPPSTVITGSREAGTTLHENTLVE